MALRSRPLPPARGSLVTGVPAAVPGTIFAQSMGGGIEVRARERRTIIFGRDRAEVHVCLGPDDRQVSRRHGRLVHRDGRWWVYNTGRLPIRLAGSRLLFTDEEPVPLADGYSPLFVHGSRKRVHLLEVYVAGDTGDRPAPRPDDVTQPPARWDLDATERLVLVVLGQRYLLHEARPVPLTWQQTATQLAEVQPEAGWSHKRVERLVEKVRLRLSAHGVPDLTRDEVPEPIGNTLNDNLLRELLLTTTLTPRDLVLIAPPD
jgi:hypothetical protein